MSLTDSNKKKNYSNVTNGNTKVAELPKFNKTKLINQILFCVQVLADRHVHVKVVTTIFTVTARQSHLKLHLF